MVKRTEPKEAAQTSLLCRSFRDTSIAE